MGKSESGYIYPHYHCAKCDAIIEKGTEYSKKQVSEKGYPGMDYFCSAECADLLQKQEKSKKKSKYLMWIMIAGYVVVMVIVFIFIL